MEIQKYTARDLFDWIVNQKNFVLLDVRNTKQVARFQIEGPHPVEMMNLPYIDFIYEEEQDENIAKVPRGRTIRVVCAKEGSSQFVAEALVESGFDDVAIMEGGIKSWGNLLVPKQICSQDDWRLYQFIRPAKASCSYGLIAGQQLAVFDPCINVEFYQTFADQMGCKLVKTFETHLQADYISGSPTLGSEHGAEIIGQANDFKDAAFAYTAVQDRQLYNLDQGPSIQAIHTPGHTPGSTCYLIDGRYLISGDTVFIVSIGRPDLGGKAQEWSKLLFDTMKTTIGAMDDQTSVLPGHFVNWDEANSDLLFMDTLGRIKANNRSIYDIETETAFYEFIQANMREQPEEYARIRQINAGLITVDAKEQAIMDLGKNECAASANPA